MYTFTKIFYILYQLINILFQMIKKKTNNYNIFIN